MKEIKIGSVLKEKLKTSGLTLGGISRRTKIPYSTLHTWLQNRQPKDIVKVKCLADFLEMTLDELLFAEREKKKGMNADCSPSQMRYEVLVKRLDL